MAIDERIKGVYQEKAAKAMNLMTLLSEWVAEPKDMEQVLENVMILKDKILLERKVAKQHHPFLETDINLVILDYYFYQMKARLDTASYRHNAVDTGILGDVTPFSFIAFRNPAYDPNRAMIPSANHNMPLNLFNGFDILQPDGEMIAYMQGLFQKWKPGQNVLYEGV